MERRSLARTNREKWVVILQDCTKWLRGLCFCLLRRLICVVWPIGRQSIRHALDRINYQNDYSVTAELVERYVITYPSRNCGQGGLLKTINLIIHEWHWDNVYKVTKSSVSVAKAIITFRFLFRRLKFIRLVLNALVIQSCALSVVPRVGPLSRPMKSDDAFSLQFVCWLFT